LGLIRLDQATGPHPVLASTVRSGLGWASCSPSSEASPCRWWRLSPRRRR